MSAITVDGLCKTFVSPRTGEEVEALRDISLEVSANEFLSIVGPSGCGKSTLLSLIAGLTRPTRGGIYVGGAPITGPGPERGMLFQDYALFPWQTVAENITFGPRARGVRAAERRAISMRMIGIVGLDGFEDRYPHELSGGMRQRCALARMLANEPRIWLMDEPLAAVDLQTRTLLQEEILRIWGEEAGKDLRSTVLFVTHGIDEAVLMADRVVVLGRRPGRIREIVDVDLPRPRFAERDIAREGALVEHIWGLIRDEAARAIVD
jgi:NitT/TauT family transport system ATP-binding protein